ENMVPFFGICLGMQAAVIEFARNVANLKGANSTEFDPDTPYPVIDLLPDQRSKREKGGTMRLGNYLCVLNDSKSKNLYGKEKVFERHRHRYELNAEFVSTLEKAGMTMAGYNPEYGVVEIIEISDHPWFVGVQFHPEFLSRPNRPHPLFLGFVEAAYQHKLKR
ncbi:MAG: synthase, partial [Candidatus Atribacteria bacterium]|nr:synthase [Candidatus Atribacteria bacterium]